jgi:hypothetical protein
VFLQLLVGCRLQLRRSGAGLLLAPTSARLAFSRLPLLCCNHLSANPGLPGSAFFERKRKGAIPLGNRPCIRRIDFFFGAAKLPRLLSEGAALRSPSQSHVNSDFAQTSSRVVSHVPFSLQPLPPLPLRPFAKVKISMRYLKILSISPHAREPVEVVRIHQES